MNQASKKIYIRDIIDSDLNDVVQIHLLAFPDFFLTQLGWKFLHELYKNFIRSKNSIFKVAEVDSRIQGFIVGNLHPKSFFKRMLVHSGHKLLYFALKALLCNPIVVIRKLFYALKYRGEQPEEFGNSALLSSVGVHPKMDNNGIGSKLVEAFCDEAFSHGADAVYLTTDRTSNELVNNFYLKNGFRVDSVINQLNNRKMNRYIKYLDEKDL